MKTDSKNWTIFGAVKWSLTVAVGGALVLFFSTLLEENYRKFIEDHGWDNGFVRTLSTIFELLPYRGTWFFFGLILGAAALVWLVWAFPHRLGESDAHQSYTKKWGVIFVVALLIGGSSIYLYVSPITYLNTHDLDTKITSLKAQLANLQGQQLEFEPLPILKRKIEQPEEYDLRNKLSVISDSIQSVDQSLSAPSIAAILDPFTNRGQGVLDLGRNATLASETSKKLRTLSADLQQDVITSGSIEKELVEMLGGSQWQRLSALEDVAEALDRYAIVASKLSGSAEKSDLDFVSSMLQSPEQAIILPAQKLYSWRSQIPQRIKALGSGPIKSLAEVRID